MVASAKPRDERRDDGLGVIHSSLITLGLAILPASRSSESPEADTLARRMAGGAAWTLLAFAAGKFLGFGTNIALARLLDPADFGVVSFAMVLIGAFLLLQDLGVGAAIVYTKADIGKIGGTALTINLATASALFVATALISGAISAFSDADELAAIVTVLALGLVATAAGSVQAALLTKELAFRRKFLPDVLPLLLSGIVSIALALLGYGVWSLVWGYLTKSVSATFALWLIAPARPRPQFDRQIASDLLRYGRHISLSSVIGFAVQNIDYFIVGHRLGTAALGLYTLAFTVASLPSTIVGQQIATATFPAYTRLRSAPVTLTKLFGDTFTITCALAIALGAAICIGMPSLIGPLLGEKWLGIIGPLQILTIFGVVRAIEFTFSPLYRAIGRPEIMWKSSAVRLIIVTPALFWGAGRSIESVAAVQVVVGLIFIPVNGLILARLLGLGTRGLWRLLLPQLLGLVALGAVIAAGYGAPVSRVAVGHPVGATVLAALAIAAQWAVLVWWNPALLARCVESPRIVQLRRRLGGGQH
ncbi:MAG TPA: lipopolysaccharide biosynthesis protein [Thermomicrobiales bacterium]